MTRQEVINSSWKYHQRKFPGKSFQEIPHTIQQSVYADAYATTIESVRNKGYSLDDGEFALIGSVDSEGVVRAKCTWTTPKLSLEAEHAEFEARLVLPDNLFEIAEWIRGEVLYYEDREPGIGWILTNPRDPYAPKIAGVGEYVAKAFGDPVILSRLQYVAILREIIVSKKPW